MAATARSDPFEGLVRKIGYSVGLEYLQARVLDLAQTYVAQRALTGADWHQLVHETWGRKAPAAAEHIADVYAQLDLLQRHNSAVHVLPGLEVLSILFSSPPAALPHPAASKGDSEEPEVVRFVLSLKILEADGDIFLNALASRFDPEGLGTRLKLMIRHKRRVVSPFFKQSAPARRIMAAISIRNQTEAEGRPRRRTYAERSREFLSGASSIARASPTDWWDEDPFISVDYLEKVCLTRGGWAGDLGLFDRTTKSLTATGDVLLSRARALGLAFDTEDDTAFAFWPYSYDLARMSLSPELLGVPSLTSGDVVRMCAELLVRDGALSDLLERDARQPAREELAHVLEEIHKRYRAASRRGALRHDLPIFIAEPVVAFWYSRGGMPIPDLRAFVRSESQRKDRFVDVVMIHGTEGGLRLIQPSNESRRTGR